MRLTAQEYSTNKYLELSSILTKEEILNYYILAMYKDATYDEAKEICKQMINFISDSELIKSFNKHMQFRIRNFGNGKFQVIQNIFYRN